MERFAPNQGWIPPDERSPEQQSLTHEFHERVQSFCMSAAMPSESPDILIFDAIQVQHFGSLFPKVWQQSGSCVGSGGANAYVDAMVGDRVFRGDHEEVKMPFPFATYGVGRQIAGMRRPGEGSFGAAQAKACQPENFGYVGWDHQSVDKPKTKDGQWLVWTRDQEIRWSHPSAWPVDFNELKQDADDFGIHAVTKISDPDEWEAAIDQGFGVTLASMFGTKPRLEDGVLLGRWDRSWAHQMSSSGKWRHKDLGRIFWIQNQWGDFHGHDPTLFGKYGRTGGFWILDMDARRICREGEVYAHSNTGDFPAREFFWKKVATYE